MARPPAPPPRSIKELLAALPVGALTDDDLTRLTALNSCIKALKAQPTEAADHVLTHDACFQFALDMQKSLALVLARAMPARGVGRPANPQAEALKRYKAHVQAVIPHVEVVLLAAKRGADMDDIPARSAMYIDARDALEASVDALGDLPVPEGAGPYIALLHQHHAALYRNLTNLAARTHPFNGEKAPQSADNGKALIAACKALAKATLPTT